MNGELHSFIDIFGTVSLNEQETVNLKKITIPIIQRDYAQGRRDPEIERVRNRFLDALYAGLSKPITLDFIYGDIDKDGVMTPLDGQQRLTTLFLLHWYAAKKANVSKEESPFLHCFGYETRYSARDFCCRLADFTPSFTTVLSEEIIDQAWFPLDWQKDPTISSMLVMLDAIDDKFKSVEDLWEKLKNRAITFYFLPIKDMGLTDELYIKMNSRGKPLTRFEQFKAEFERSIRSIDDGTAQRIIHKIDRDWTDLLWRYRDAGNGIPDDMVIDDEFLKYFRFICDVICYQSGGALQGKSADEFDMLAEYFTGETATVRHNIETLESYFDCWCHIDGFDNPTEFLQSCMSNIHEDGKIVVYSGNKIDIFEDCLHSYTDESGRLRQFPLNRFVLLYAITCFLRNQTRINLSEFVVRLRTINNLIQNSEDEIRDGGRNRLPAILQQTDAIMLTGNVSDSIVNSFNLNQIHEEREKKEFLEKQPDLAALVYTLEDHPNLKGQIGIIGLEHIHYATRFASLFSCNRDLIDCALMSIGDYGQQVRNKRRWQYGSKSMMSAWDKLFHRSSNSRFEETKKILIQLLSRSDSFTDEILLEIRNEFISACESRMLYPWRYYYVKYDVFRPGRYGIYSNDDVSTTPYMFTVIQTTRRLSSNAYIPYLKEADDAHLSKDFMGKRLIYGDRHLICNNDAYLLRDNKTDSVIRSFPIPQNEDGIDTEDRIILLKELISSKELFASYATPDNLNDNDSMDIE